eukprot:118398_1
MLALLILTVGSIICLFSCIILHFHQHFRPRSCMRIRRRLVQQTSNLADINLLNLKDTLTTTFAESQCIPQSCIIPAGEQQFSFFPVAFIAYLMLIIALSVFVLCDFDETDCIDDIIQSVLYKWSDAQTFTSLNINHYHMKFITDISIQWIMIYSMLIISLSDSLFSFWRYYTTMYCATYFYNLSAKMVLTQFSFYAVPFCIVYALQIHVYYALFPLLIVAHITMNVWCNYMFFKILIDSTTEVAETEVILTNVNDDMLQSVYSIRRSSLVWCCVSSLCHSIFVMTSNVQIMYFFPLLWAVSSFAFTLNFARNRSKVKQTLFALRLLAYRMNCARCRSRNAVAIKKQILNTKAIANPKTTDYPSNSTQSTAESNCSEIIEEADVSKHTEHEAHLSPELIRKVPSTRKALHLHVDTTQNNDSTQAGISKTPSYKALALLGILPKPKRSLTPQIQYHSSKNVYIASKLQRLDIDVVRSTSSLVLRTSESEQKKKEENVDSKAMEAQSSVHRPSLEPPTKRLTLHNTLSKSAQLDRSVTIRSDLNRPKSAQCLEMNADRTVQMLSIWRRPKRNHLKADELVSGLNVLVLQGFVSRKSLNSVQQVHQYNVKVNTPP